MLSLATKDLSDKTLNKSQPIKTDEFIKSTESIQNIKNLILEKVKDDFSNISTFNNKKFFELGEKFKNKDYEKSLFLLYKEQGEAMGLPSEQFAESQIQQLKEKISQIPETEKEEYKQYFLEKNSDGYKTKQQEEKEIEKEVNNAYLEFKNQLYHYLKTEQGNSNEQLDRIQYMQSVLNNDPEKFNTFSEKFFNDGNIKAVYPDASRIDEIKNSSCFSSVLKSKVLSDTQRLATNEKAFGERAKKSQEQFKIYRIKEFKKGYSVAEKKSQNVNKLENNKFNLKIVKEDK